MRVNVTAPRGARALLVALGLATIAGAGVPTRLAAQAGLTHVEDAAPVPAGLLRLRVIPSWARYDARFTGSGVAPLGGQLTSPALGTAELPGLTSLESALRVLTGDANFRLSLGRSFALSTVRIVTTPISAEYGINRRLSVGVTLPVVQYQREVFLNIATTGEGAGNVGPALPAAAVHTATSRLVSEIRGAITQLQQARARCATQPAPAGCAAIVASGGSIDALIADASTVASNLASVYGTSASAPGFGLLPRSQVLDAPIAARLASLNQRFAAFLGGTPIPTQQPPGGAAGPATASDLRALARAGASGLGPDSLGRINRIGIGDLEVGLRYLLHDTRAPHAADATAAEWGPRFRVTVGALVRAATGLTAPDHELFSIGAGDGQSDAEVSAAADWDGAARLGATVVARYVAQLGSVPATRMPDENGLVNPFAFGSLGRRTPGDLIGIEASPRYRLGNAFHVAAHYALLHRTADAYAFDPPAGTTDAAPGIMPGAFATGGSAGDYTEQRVGVALAYSTLAAWERGRVRLPIEVSYSHVQTVTGTSALVPRAGRDQIQLRLYYRLRR